VEDLEGKLLLANPALLLHAGVLASVSRRLIEAQDQERIRISRELHDDIGQRIALLGIGLQELQEGPLESRGRNRRTPEADR